jgi:hypothetical protein
LPGGENGKSPVTGDCHAGILWEPGGEIPPGHPTAERRFRFVALPADGVAAAADVTLRDCLQAGPAGPGAADASGDRNDIGVT